MNTNLTGFPYKGLIPYSEEDAQFFLDANETRDHYCQPAGVALDTASRGRAVSARVPCCVPESLINYANAPRRASAPAGTPILP